MIVCVCNNISDREVRQAIELGITSMDELRNDLGVATCCGQCLDYAQEILTEHLAALNADAPAMQETVLQRPVFAA